MNSPAVFGSSKTMLTAVLALVFLLAMPLAASAASSPECTVCHTEMGVAPVNRDTACRACHLAFSGAHPYHQAGANCGAACHPGWGDSLLTATPRFLDPVSGAAFATSASKSTPAARLHAIHSQARWPASVSSPKSACASCHSIAACTACHTGAISSTHTGHSGSGNATTTAQPAWVGTMGYGVVGGDQTQQTAFAEENQCASEACHDLASTQSSRPRFTEDYNYAAGGNPDDPTGANAAITLVGTWRSRSNVLYTGSRMSYNGTAGSELAASFSGTRIEIVSDKDPYRGQAEVFIDGALAGTIDCYAATTQIQAVVFAADVAPGAHTIAVRPTGLRQASARAAFVVIDAFNVYPEARTSTAPRCASCHNPMLTHGAPHVASSTYEGEVGRPAWAPGGAATGEYHTLKCVSCHRANILADHGTDYTNCTMCHGAGKPRGSFATWNKTCQTGECHTAAPAVIGYAPHPAPTVPMDHTTVVASGEQPTGYCQSCHGNPEGWQCGAPFGCHASTTPPFTSVDYKAPVTAASRIAEEPITWRLNATDVGDGIVATYYSWDGEPFTLYSAADHASGITNPDDGQAPYAHTLRFYSVDAAGNTEAVVTENYNVTDSLAPNVLFGGVTIGANTYATKTLNLQVVDPKVNGLNTGVAFLHTEVKTYKTVWGSPVTTSLWLSLSDFSWPLDGTWDSTRTISPFESYVYNKNAPPWLTFGGALNPGGGGNGRFELQYYARDYTGNQTPMTYAYVYIDNTGPTTTATKVSGVWRWKLSSYDNWSAGVDKSYYRFDGGAWTEYTVADNTNGVGHPGGDTAGAHTMDYYSTDRLGNVETYKTVNYTVP